MASVTIMASVTVMASVTYGTCNYGKWIYGKSIMANVTEPVSFVEGEKDRKI